jgi:hypothetical protein
MARLLALSLAIVSMASFGGCAMCCAPFDCDYPSVPGRWVRHNPTSGRVGSAFDEAGGPAGVEQASDTDSSVQFEELQRALPTPGTPTPAPAQRSVIPRSMGETYLPRGQ